GVSFLAKEMLRVPYYLSNNTEEAKKLIKKHLKQENSWLLCMNHIPKETPKSILTVSGKTNIYQMTNILEIMQFNKYHEKPECLTISYVTGTKTLYVLAQGGATIAIGITKRLRDAGLISVWSRLY